MITGNKNNGPGPDLPDEDELYLRKNRISSVEVPLEQQHAINTKKPVIILGSIAGVLLIAVIAVTTYFLKRPATFISGDKTKKSGLEEVEKDLKLQSDNIHIKRGRESYSRGYLNDAITEFNEVLESDASDKDKAIALTYLGMISDDRGGYDKAIEYYTRAAKYDKGNPVIYKNLSLTYRHKKDYDRAAEFAKKSIDLNADDVENQLLLGNIYFQQNRYEEAVAQYQQALERSPENAKLLYNLATAMLKKGDEFAAIEYYKKAGAADRIGDIAHQAYSNVGVLYLQRNVYDEAEKFLKMAVSMRPNDAQNRYNLGIVYLRQNKKTAALEELEKAAALSGENTEILEGIADKYLEMKEYDKSLDAYTKVSKIKTRDARVLSQMGDIYYQKGELDRAFNHFRKVTEIQPATENARIAYLNMGIILDEMERYNEAIENYKKALALSPKDSGVYYNLGITYKHAGKPELAIDAWKKASTLDVNNPKPLMAIADYYYEKKLYDLAEKSYTSILETWPKVQDAHFKIATMYYKRGQYRYAMQAYNKVISINERNDLARRSYINLAMIKSQGAGGEDAEKALESSEALIQKALMLKPGDPDAHFALAMIYLKQTNYDKAIETFHQVIAVTRDSRLISESYHHIGKAYYKDKQYKKALQAYTRGLEEDPANEEMRINRKTAMQAYEAQLNSE